MYDWFLKSETCHSWDCYDADIEEPVLSIRAMKAVNSFSIHDCI